MRYRMALLFLTFVLMLGSACGNDKKEKAQPTDENATTEDQADPTVSKVSSINIITLQVEFNKALPKEAVELETAKKNFVFDNGLSIVNVPQLKSGSKSTYIVPVTSQQAGTNYNLTYNGKKTVKFQANTTKIPFHLSRQVTADTFELESFRDDGVTDYGYVIEAYRKGRGDLAFELDNENTAKGKSFLIISSLRDREVVITPAGGKPIPAKYVPFTQSTDGLQEPKFRLPEGQVLQSGTSYTVSADWIEMRDDNFVAETVEPLKIISGASVSDTAVNITLFADPKDELFAGRSVKLTSDAGEVMAMYKYQSRKNATGTFELQDGAKLKTGVVYRVEPVGNWATADNVEVTTTPAPKK
ncbi:hypothetical protein [Paenibacillus swuensis]